MRRQALSASPSNQVYADIHTYRYISKVVQRCLSAVCLTVHPGICRHTYIQIHESAADSAV